MTSKETSAPKERRSISSLQVGFIFTGLAIFAPAYVNIYWSFIDNSTSVQVCSMLWLAWFSDMIVGWLFASGFFAFGQSMMYTILRPLFAIQMVRYYRGDSSKKLTLLIGLLLDLQPIIVNFPTVLWSTESNLILRVPVLLTFLVAIIIIQFIPPQQKPKEWLEEESENSLQSNDRFPQLSRLDIIYKILETVLVSEIILLVWGGLFVFNLSPFSLRIFYWIVLPWLTLITGILFLIVRYLRKTYLLEEVPS